MRVLVMLAGGLSVLASAPAFGASYSVTATSNVFTPASVPIYQGDTVTWTNGGGFHNVRFDDGQFEMPPDPIDAMWSYTRIFAQSGTYRYVCEAHVADGMIGTVVVNAAPPGGGGGGGGGGGPGPGGGTAPDTAPTASLAGPAKQDVDKLFVRASMNEAGTLIATGTVTVPGASKAYRLKRVSRTVTAGQTVKLRLKLRSKALKAVKRALRGGRKVRARINLTARDTTGKRTLRKRTIRLRS